MLLWNDSSKHKPHKGRTIIEGDPLSIFMRVVDVDDDYLSKWDINPAYRPTLWAYINRPKLL